LFSGIFATAMAELLVFKEPDLSISLTFAIKSGNGHLLSKAAF
jgi:hypothetical protein